MHDGKNESTDHPMKPFFLFPPVFAACFIPAVLPASTVMVDGGHITDEDLALARNPIIIENRLRLTTEHASLGGGGSVDKFIFAAVHGFGVNEHDRDFFIGFEVPYLHHNPDAGGDRWGIGDLKLRCGQLFIDDPEGWRAGWFFDTELDTAADSVHAVANQRTQMAIGGGAGYAILENVVLTSTVQYGWSLDNGDTTGRKSEWEAHLTASMKVWEGVSVNLDYKAVVNTVGDDKLFNTLEPSIGWTVGESDKIGLFASCEIPLDETGTDWIAKAGLVWFF